MSEKSSNPATKAQLYSSVEGPKTKNRTVRTSPLSFADIVVYLFFAFVAGYIVGSLP